MTYINVRSVRMERLKEQLQGIKDIADSLDNARHAAQGPDSNAQKLRRIAAVIRAEVDRMR